MNNAAINVCVQVFVLTYIFTSLGYIPRNGIAKSFIKKKYMYIVSMRLCAHECMCLYTNTILLSIFISVIMTQRDGMGRDVGGAGSGWGTCVYPWWIHVDVWQNQYNIVK